MSSSYMLASITSLIVVIFYLINYVLETKVNIYMCNVLRRIATICTNFVYVMPLFISIERFLKILFQKSFNVIPLTTVIIIIEIPNISKQLSSIVSSHVTRTSDSICGVTIVVNNEFINIMNNVSYSITIAAPIIGCIINFIIYIISVKKLSKGHPNKTIIKQEKALFISVLIQSSFPLIFFGTSSTVPFVIEKLKTSKEIGWRIVDFIIYFGYTTCILVSSFFVKALRNMVLNDFRILKKDTSVIRLFKSTW
uniref:G_PROTEIN_RECEP_F1_2 domain-containing protein n=1 Tax=Strongyloides venezuelensis TaxID=75913 RepID=A0A0K0F1Y2_STRVS